MLNPSKGYGYDDLLLVPQYSQLGSRSEPTLTSKLDAYICLDLPIISSPMDTITEQEMAVFMAEQGGLGIIHRYLSEGDQAKQVRGVKELAKDYRGYKVGASVGSNDAKSRIAALLEEKVDLLAIDVAHGDSASVYATIEWIKNESSTVVVLSGNIATAEAARRTASAGADLFRVGIGAGSVCTTRLVAGVGVPQLSAIASIHDALPGYPIVADGGIRNAGDVVKALAAGAEAVMMGGWFAGFRETPRPGVYRGMASVDALHRYKGTESPLATTPEGVSVSARPAGGDSALLLAQFVRQIKQGLGYMGAQSIEQLREVANWTEVSGLGYQEGEAHYLG